MTATRPILDQIVTNFERLTIDISPCSTPPSTPTCESAARPFFDLDAEKSETPDDQPCKSTVQSLVDSIQTAYTVRLSQDAIIAHEDTLVNHLHITAVTLTDV